LHLIEERFFKESAEGWSVHLFFEELAVFSFTIMVFMTISNSMYRLSYSCQGGVFSYVGNKSSIFLILFQVVEIGVAVSVALNFYTVQCSKAFLANGPVRLAVSLTATSASLCSCLRMYLRIFSTP